MATYGWVGRLTATEYGRHIDGRLQTNARPRDVDYVEYANDADLQAYVVGAAMSEFNEFDFGVTAGDVIVTEAPTSVPDDGGGFFDETVNVAIVCVVIIVSLVIILVIVAIVVFGRRRKEPARKR